MDEQQLRRWHTTFIVLTLAIRVVSDAERVAWNNDSPSFCGVSQKQGRRPYQEDRIICMPDILLPGPGGCSSHVGLFGVFDGHNGAEASEYASTCLPHMLRHHTWSILMLESNHAGGDICLEPESAGGDLRDPSFLCVNERLWQRFTSGYEKMFFGNCEDTQLSTCWYRAVLKEAISRSLADLDSALRKNFNKKVHQSGTTAVVVLKVDSHLLVANIGDSQAFICSSFISADFFQSGIMEDAPEMNIYLSNEAAGRFVPSILTKELTVAHHPDRADEKFRIEAAGGFVSTWGGVARVNGQLAVSRALGDAMFKKFGVTAEPEFFGWQELTAEDLLLIITSDGIFETMRPQDVCNLLQDKYNLINSSLLDNELADSRLSYEALAITVTEAAYNSGSYDNLAAIVFPLASSSLAARTFRPTETLSSSRSLNEIISDKFSTGKEAPICYQLIDKARSGVVLPLENSVGPVSNVGEVYVMNSSALIKDTIEIGDVYKQSAGSAATLDIYHEHLICFRRPVLSDEDEACLNPETFSTYLRLIEAVPVLERSCTEMNVSDKVKSMELDNVYPYTSIHQRYILTENIGRGGFGEVWFAVMRSCSDVGATDIALHLKMVHDLHFGSKELKSDTLVRKLMESSTESTNDDPSQERFVLKRVMGEKGDSVYLSGLRERYFGEVFVNAMALRKSTNTNNHNTRAAQETEDGLNHIARYIETIQGKQEGDFWLVFKNEGYPLSSMLYTTDTTIEKDKGHVRVLEPSNWWRWLKSTKDGRREMRNLLHQLLLGVKACHDRNITHRDIKPENMMVRPTSMCLVHGEFNQLAGEFPCNLSMRIIDFGSAIDVYTLQNLYGSFGPTRYEQTEEYTPPESFLQRSWWKKHGIEAFRYDLWSIGVVMLELVLGTPHVFQIAARTRALLDKHLEGWGSSALNTAYMLRALMEMCILYPGKSGHQRPAAMDNSNLASWMCTEENLMLQIKNRDPLGMGYAS
ncbi:hypothetical protein GOP47_0016639 [Adiantum capillus-veneris]|uniref:Protein-serine/threonine phosphatase n=1 Tax=Adiantum capillus-veneris TaxID=13818 RepID=A0A9D4UIV1_ADICA|nr:hypothetical protein GOP47_0016639 [Adiantum capillus-veneris]